VNDAVASFGLFSASRRLMPHQEEGVDFLAGNRAALLADDMGARVRLLFVPLTRSRLVRS